MTRRTEIRVREVHRRVREKRRRRERRIRSGLTGTSLCLLAGIVWLLKGVQTPGVSTVAGSYSAVLLRDGAGAYILVGIAAFVLGVVVTMLCIRYRVRKGNQMTSLAEKEERI